jgi:multicomponent K+:H+ antiporter subunit E
VIAVPVLLYRLLADLVLSGLRVARLIVLREQPASGYVRMRYAPMSDRGATILASLVAIAPGSTVIHLDLEQRELILHLLDLSSASTLVAEIRRDFETPLVSLFGTTPR